MEGWVKLHRKLSDNPIWFAEKFTRGQAWVDLILLANHQDSYFYKRGVKINVKRGQLGRSEVELSDRWSWSRSKVRKFLNDLEKEQQIEQHKTNVTQLVTIINYDNYQQKEQQTEQQKDSKRTAKEQQKDTYKNVKNVKNDNNEKNNYKKTLLSNLKKSDVVNQEYFEITIAFWELFKKNILEVGGSVTTLEKAKGTWIDSIRLLIEADKQSKESIRIVFSFLQEDVFWKKNILSTITLRKQFNKLLLSAKNQTNGANKQKKPATSDEQLANIVAGMFSKKG